MSQYFDEACKSSYIARDTSCNIPQTDEDERSIKQELYRRLCKWETELPPAFELIENPAPYIIILKYVMDSSLPRLLPSGL